MIPTLSDSELALMNELLLSELGICFPEHKREILESRLRPRLQALRLRTFLDYYAMLECGGGELKQLAQLVTNNESYFFRETYQFDSLFSEAIADLKGVVNGAHRFRFLSAGCSSGEEPYTLNILAKENQYRMFGYDVDIDAFDVSACRVEMAQSALYTRMSLRALEPESIAKYFLPEGDAHRLKAMWRAGVRFRVANLLHASTYGEPQSYDVIFCRNVLIYFSEETLRLAVEQFARALRDHGLLFVGHSESLIGVSPLLEPVRLGNCIAYRRVPR